MKIIKTQVTVIGSGIAGLIYALQCAEFCRVTVVTKGNPEQSNTQMAQGGIAAVLANGDSPEKHVQDTLTAGGGLCNEKTVRWMVGHAPEAIRELEKFGVQFDKLPNKTFDLHREAGHSVSRIVHHKDDTGMEIENSLLAKAKSNPNIQFLAKHFAIDLITNNNCCYGVTVLDEIKNELLQIQSSITFLATGGAGQIFFQNTNDVVATGDGFAMAHRAGAKLMNMEFIQFHPTTFYAPDKKTFLITEAVRGFGAQLKNKNGEPFMHKYHLLESLAPRDIVSFAIANELKNQNAPCMYLDLRPFAFSEIKNHFPNLVIRCEAQKINLQTEMIPVVPAAHYMCGGIATDKTGRTSIENLFAAGEVACTGVHGANRLASNSLLEAVVFSDQAALETKKIILQKDNMNPENIFCEEIKTDSDEIDLSEMKINLQKLMWNYCGIIRTEAGLNRCKNELHKMHLHLTELIKKNGISFSKLELRNELETALLIAEAAMNREESVGCHYISQMENAPALR